MFAVEIEGMCEGKNRPRFSIYESAYFCFQEAVDFCMKFRHNTTIHLVDLDSGRKIISVVVDPNRLPF